MSVRWKKRNSKNRSKNEMVLKGLEEQRLKALKEESVSELKEKKNRMILLQWMMDFCSDHGLSVETCQLAICLLDRFMSVCGSAYVNRGNLQLAGVAALLVSVKNLVGV